MSDDDIHGLLGAYAVDAVDDVERARFEAHMAGCAQCRDEVASLRAAANELTLVSVAAPPPSLRASILREISSVRPLPPRVTPERQASAHEVAAPSAAPTAPLAPTPVPPPTLESKRTDRSRRAPLRQWLAGASTAAVRATGGPVRHPSFPYTSNIQLHATQQSLHAQYDQPF